MLSFEQKKYCVVLNRGATGMVHVAPSSLPLSWSQKTWLKVPIDLCLGIEEGLVARYERTIAIYGGLFWENGPTEKPNLRTN